MAQTEQADFCPFLDVDRSKQDVADPDAFAAH